jgi:hypothetical protein
VDPTSRPGSGYVQARHAVRERGQFRERTLELKTYVATSSEAGAPTRSQITQLPDASSVSLLWDGSPVRGLDTSRPGFHRNRDRRRQDALLDF